MLHWDATSWTGVNHQGGGGAFAVVAPNNIYAVGAEIAHWNGSSWTMLDTLPQYPEPGLISTFVLPGGEVWAGGRMVDTGGMRTLVLRSKYQ